MANSEQSFDDQYNHADDLYDAGEYATAFKIFMSLAKQGDTASMCRVATQYQLGLGVSHDFETGIRWEKKAAKAGDLSALINLGVSYRNKGRAREARHWFEKAIKAGDDDAAFELAQLYYVSDKEYEVVEKLLNIAINGTNICEQSREDAQALMEKLIKLQKSQS